MGITQYRLAKEIGVPAQRIGDIVARKRGITADTDLRLCRFFGLSDRVIGTRQARFQPVLFASDDSPMHVRRA